MKDTSPNFLAHIHDISDGDLFAALDGKFSPIDAWIDQWQNRSGEFLFRDSDDLLVSRQQAITSFEPLREIILQAADRVLRHHIQGWGDVSIQHGTTVDFNADYGKNGKYGFHYWFWARPLIQACLLTNDQRYLREFDALFNDWYAQRANIQGDIAELDVIYYELGLGLRTRTFLEYYALPFARRSSQSHLNMLKTLLGAARWLYQHEQTGYRLGNWQIMGCTGLAWIASYLPEFAESAQWQQTALTRLTEHAANDIDADGCHSERVPGSYMLTAYKDFQNVKKLIGNTALKETCERMLHWYMQTLPADGVIPAINDGARLAFPQQLLNQGLAQFPAARTQSACLKASGFTVLRHGDHFMLINHSPAAGGHTHDEALSFELHHGNAPLAIDSGIGKTYDDPLHETWYRTPAAHNMLEVQGALLDRTQSAGRDIIFAHTPLLQYFAATHHGYEKSAGMIHRRHVVSVRAGYLLILDDVTLESSNDSRSDFRDSRNVLVAEASARSTSRLLDKVSTQVDSAGASAPLHLIWHLHSPTTLQQVTFGFRTDSSPPFSILRPTNLPCQPIQSLAPASVTGIAGFPDYADITWLQFHDHLLAGKYFLPTLLCFTNDAELIQPSPGHWLIHHDQLTDHLFLPAAKQNHNPPEVCFDGQLAFWRRRNQQITQWAAIGATQFRLGDQLLHQSVEPTNISGEL